MNRRLFLKSFAFAGIFLANNPLKSHSLIRFDEKQLSSLEIFKSIIEKAISEKWSNLPTGDRIIEVAKCFIGFQYKGGTLEGEGAEVCRYDLTGLDCVTIVEYSLCISRIIEKQKLSFDSFLDELVFVRYRDGKLTDYTSRLHYTSDWIFDNQKKGVLVDVTHEIGGKEFNPNVGFMSQNPQYYQALKENPDYVKRIKEIEKSINSRKHFYIPINEIPKQLKKICNGDIISIVTSTKGLDYSHLGLAYISNKGEVKFLHASSRHKEVVIENSILEYLKTNKSATGISVARVLD